MQEIVRDFISKKTDENIEYLKDVYKDNVDLIFREFYVGKWKGALVYIDGMTDKILLDDYVLESLMTLGDTVQSTKEIKEKILTVSDVKESMKLTEALKFMMAGDTLMFLDDLDYCYIIGNRFFTVRGVSEPLNETTIKGAKEGFTETIRFNTVLVRRKIRDTRFKMEYLSLGQRSKTDTVIMYIDDIVDKDILKELKQRLNKIDIDAVLDSGYVEQMIEDNKWSPFPQVQTTERPDVVAAALYEGRISILVDNSPMALIVPATLPNLFQSPDDYYERWTNGSVVRILRAFAIFLSITLPSLYVAITSFHTSIIPTKLAYSIAASREGVPFPASVEAIIMDISLALLMEAVVRLPKPVGSTIGIVGGLILGQSAVSAGIVSPIMIIIVSITAISSFITPNYEISMAIRLMRFALIIASSIAGLYGIMLGLMVLVVHLIKLKSFGVDYLSPITTPHKNDMKDVFWRAPFDYFKERPSYINPQDKVRQK